MAGRPVASILFLSLMEYQRHFSRNPSLSGQAQNWLYIFIKLVCWSNSTVCKSRKLGRADPDSPTVWTRWSHSTKDFSPRALPAFCSSDSSVTLSEFSELAAEFFRSGHNYRFFKQGDKEINRRPLINESILLFSIVVFPFLSCCSVILHPPGKRIPILFLFHSGTGPSFPQYSSTVPILSPSIRIKDTTWKDRNHPLCGREQPLYWGLPPFLQPFTSPAHSPG